MQEKLDIRIIENMERPPPAELDKWISMFATAIIHEATELQNLTNWKWWKRSREFDKEKAIEEIIDIWHFVVAASIEVGMRPHDILREYERKNKINHQRQSEGY
jgi:dimeric dUTPase (all-alpha-NTP-PPase superfamily)